jgi:hypothetical protein
LRLWFKYPFVSVSRLVVEDTIMVVEDAVEEVFVKDEYVLDILNIEGKLTEKFDTIPFV